jgi:OmcA/MtrC family decaheme c-type cytochrome
VITPSGASTDQPTRVPSGTYTSLGNGVYAFSFQLQPSSNLDTNSTNTLGIYARRDLTEFGYPDTNSFVANATLDFVPSGARVTQVRDVVETANCNQCHDPLGVHGGARREVRLCILCHNPSNTDPNTGNSLDFKIFIHKIHMGANLPSVTGAPLNILGTSGSSATTATGGTQSPRPAGYVPPGVPYQIGGGTQSVSDFSSVVWPQDVRNCTTCHQNGTQSDNYKNNSSRAACGSCHDDVNFNTGANHGSIVQADDTKCVTCHRADSGQEFDLSVIGGHTIPTNSTQLAGLNVKIMQVTNTNPGNNPRVTFTVTNNNGNAVDPSKLARLLLTIAGPASDYATDPPWQEDARQATPVTNGYTYTFQGALPANAGGTWAVGAEAYRNVTIIGSLMPQGIPVRESAFNPVYYFGIGAATAAVPRRKVVDVANCNQCHKLLAHHGNARKNTEYCILCHNPNHGDNNTPKSTVNLSTMVHGIHMGENLQNVYTINSTNYNGLRFPGDQRNCSKCHVQTTFTLPLPNGLIPTIDATFFYSPLQPAAAACLGCHNSLNDAIHAYVNTAFFGESCAVCHSEDDQFAVTRVHAGAWQY